MHRKGSRPSSWTNTAVIAHLRSEVAELADELDLLKLTGKAPVALARAREELCDVYSVVLHLKERLGLSLEELDALSAEKLPTRFTLRDIE